MRTDDQTSRGVLICAAGVCASLIAPGTGHLVIRADTRRPGVIIATLSSLLATGALLWVLLTAGSHRAVVELVADRARFLTIDGALVVLALTRLWAAGDVAWQARPRGSGRVAVAATLSTALVIAGVAPLAVAADYVWRTDQALEHVFGSGEAQTAEPGSLTTTTLGDRDPRPPATLEASTTTTIQPFAGTDRVNVLLLGGDAGAGRWSLRTDTMVVVSIDPESGDTALVSIPRNLAGLPFPPGTPLADKYPKGFPDIANAVYPYVNGHRQLAGGGEDAGAQAIKLGIAQLLGIPIQYYVLVDMRGFIDVVDAIGGIDVNVKQRVPAPGDPREAKYISPAYYEVGLHHFDGTAALSYSRSRKADSDYQRMERQRCVLMGIADAASPRALLRGLGDLMDAFGAAVRTDIPRERIGEVVQLVERYSAAGGVAAVRTLILTPPNINPARWKAQHVRDLVAEVLTPVVVPPTPTTEPDSTTPTTTATPTTTTLPPDVLAAECA